MERTQAPSVEPLLLKWETDYSLEGISPLSQDSTRIPSDGWEQVSPSNDSLTGWDSANRLDPPRYDLSCQKIALWAATFPVWLGYAAFGGVHIGRPASAILEDIASIFNRARSDQSLLSRLAAIKELIEHPYASCIHRRTTCKSRLLLLFRSSHFQEEERLSSPRLLVGERIKEALEAHPLYDSKLCGEDLHSIPYLYRTSREEASQKLESLLASLSKVGGLIDIKHIYEPSLEKVWKEGEKEAFIAFMVEKVIIPIESIWEDLETGDRSRILGELKSFWLYVSGDLKRKICKELKGQGLPRSSIIQRVLQFNLYR